MKCIHLDFHTSPDISGIGKRFDHKKFVKTIKDAKVDLMTVFAKCHHGYTYYPSKVSTIHPGLDFDLLAAEINAIHEAGAKAPIYIPIGWSEKDADEHPEWHQIEFFSKTTLKTNSKKSESDDPSAPLGDCAWTMLCPCGGYMEHLEALTREICERYDVSDGIFYDICFMNTTCICEACCAGMREMGLDPEKHEDVKRYYTHARIDMMKRLTGVVHEYSPNANVFYNGGASMQHPEYLPYQTHYELEDLPTAWGGYDLMPIRAKYMERYGKLYLGMTGKFHLTWGEFGGFKNKEALRYECADMLSVGASISIGDHLHPSGDIDESTYAIIGHSFNYVDKIEGYSENTATYTDIAIWCGGGYDSEIGASKILQNMHVDFDVITSGDDIEKYNCIILPDRFAFDEDDKIALRAFAEHGGKIIASHAAVFDELGIRKIAPSEYSPDYIRCDVEDVVTPFLSYSRAYRVECDGEVMAKVYEPYFNRTVGRYCGHNNTPYKDEPADYPALVRCGNVLYFAHPVFEAYHKSGNYILERYIINAIDSIYERGIVAEELPSCARVRLREEKDGKFLALHLLYAPPVNRGNACILPDFPKLHDVKVTLKTDKSITSVKSAPDGESVPFTVGNGSVTLSIPPFSLHKLIILE